MKEPLSNQKNTDDKHVDTEDGDSPDISSLEALIAKEAMQEAKTPPTTELTQYVQKQQNASEFMRLGVHGILTMLLSVFAPFFMRTKQKHINKRQNK